MCPPNCQCGRHRPHKHTAEAKAKVSAARREQTLATPYELPDQKKCSKCGLIKPREAYTIVKRKLKTTGKDREYLRSWCKQCERRRGQDFRNRKRSEGTWHEYTDRQAEAVKSDPERREHRRRYQREWSAAKRRREGRKTNGGWKRYRDQGRDALPIEPFSAWLAQQAERLSLKHIEALSGVNEKQLRRIIRKRNSDKEKEIKLISIDLMDRIIIALDYPELMSVMYHDVEAVKCNDDLS